MKGSVGAQLLPGLNPQQEPWCAGGMALGSSTKTNATLSFLTYEENFLTYEEKEGGTNNILKGKVCLVPLL